MQEGLCFRAGKYTSELLSHNIEINGYKNIVQERLAVGNRTEVRGLSINKVDIGSNSFISQGPREKDLEPVSVIKLDDYFKGRPKPYIIKMDVEGWEEQVILGGKKTFRAAKLVVFENNPKINKAQSRLEMNYLSY